MTETHTQKKWAVEFRDTAKKRPKWERCMTFTDKVKAEEYAERSRRSKVTGTGRFEFRVQRFSEPTFEQALHDLPSDVDYDPLAMKTINDLRWASQLQLDLIEEGQDSTEGDDPRPIRRWLKKYGTPIK